MALLPPYCYHLIDPLHLLFFFLSYILNIFFLSSLLFSGPVNRGLGGRLLPINEVVRFRSVRSGQEIPCLVLIHFDSQCHFVLFIISLVLNRRASHPSYQLPLKPNIFIMELQLCFLILTFLALPCLALPCHATLCLILSYLAMPYLI